jgi:hypothetical protein
VIEYLDRLFVEAEEIFQGHWGGEDEEGLELEEEEACEEIQVQWEQR